jgi:hypothetical protein
VRKQVVASIVIALIAAGCSDAGRAGWTPSAPAQPMRVRQSPRPFAEVAADRVHALIPDRWQPRPVTSSPGDGGFFASPRPRGWQRMDGSVQGMAATWVDEGRGGIPSDFYYLAATGPALRQLIHSPDCRAESTRVIVNHRPDYFRGHRGSPGDYVARGRGTCSRGMTGTRWAYFVAAPGFGPVRKVGIPSSGLYVVVAVLRDSAGASERLHTLLSGARFGNAGVSDLIAAARPGAQPL